MKIKKKFRTLKLKYEIYLWVKNFNDTSSTIYKQECELLRNFKQVIFKCRKTKKKLKLNKDKLEIESRLVSLNKNSELAPVYHPQSPNFCSI